MKATLWCCWLGAALVACGGGGEGGGTGGSGPTTSSSSGSTTSSTSTGAGGTTGTGTGGSSGSAGGEVDGSTPSVDAGTCGVSAGACVNASDCALGKAQIDPKVTTCARSCTGGSKCTADCLAKDGVSMGCAQCYGDATQCGRDNCAAPCFADPSSKDCRDCTKAKGCDDKFLACAGW